MAWDRTRIGTRTLRPPLEPTPGLHCDSCHMPADAFHKVIEFALVISGKAAGRYALCDRCWRHANPPQPVDPLDVTEVA